MERVNKVGDIVTHSERLKGTWLVIATAMTGGGTGHGPHDVYPDGHRITLIEITDWDGGSDIEIRAGAQMRHYYQTGAFSGKIEYLVPLAHFPFEQE